MLSFVLRVICCYFCLSCFAFWVLVFTVLRFSCNVSVFVFIPLVFMGLKCISLVFRAVIQHV